MITKVIMNYADQHVKSWISVKTTRCLYSPVLMIFLAFAIIFSGCNKDTKRDLYSQNYDELVTYYINIDSLAKGMDVKVENLIKMRYGLIESNPDLASEMSKLTEAYKKFDDKKVEKILSITLN